VSGGTWGVVEWNWYWIRGQVAARGRLVLYQVDQASYRAEIVQVAARHGLKVRVIDRCTVALEL
jgi:hypothetical protein